MHSPTIVRPGRQHQPLKAFLLLVLAGAAWFGGFSAPSAAFAHSDYDRATPGKSESVPEAPARLDMYTTQDMFKQEGENELQVFDEAGTRVDDGNTVVDDDNRRHLSVGLQPDLPPGRYIVRWKTFSDEDGERFSGAFAFYVGVQPTTDQLHEDREMEEQAEVNAEATAEAAEAVEEQEATEEPASTEVAAASPTAPAASENGGSTDGDGAPVGLIAGIVVAAVAVVVIGAGGFAITRWRRA